MRQCRLAAVATRFLDQPGLVEELITIEHFLLVPRTAADRETVPQAFTPAKRAGRFVAEGARRPVDQQRQDGFIKNVGPARAPVFPWKEAVPRLEAGAGWTQHRCVVGHARKGEIADRDNMRAGVDDARVAATIAKCIKLLDIAE